MLANFGAGFKIFNFNFMCTLLTDLYCPKIKFYRKPRYTHFCSVWNIILSSLYQKCRIWILSKNKELNTQIICKISKSLNWSKTRRWNFTWLPVNRWRQLRRWKAIGSSQMVTLKHRIRWNLRGEKFFKFNFYFCNTAKNLRLRK